ncbi:MAG TPA: class I SAM-dependent methyltransferase [Burkholderiaceae bacterium]|nr:class I SAM-dependent methyltransferase [Burkholderiaceae bacterium]
MNERSVVPENLNDVDYVHTFFPALSPHRARLRLLCLGIQCPEISNACELGFGLGISTAIHSASSNVNWYGADFNVNQAAFAQGLINTSGSNAKLYHEEFEDFFDRVDLPDFDFIGLHGVWSWVPSYTRDQIVDFIRRKLKPDGVVYISYNTMPRCAPMLPLRELMVEFTQRNKVRGQSAAATASNALQFLDKFWAINPSYKQTCPDLGQRIEDLKKENPAQIAHEYLASDWQPINFWQMVNELDRSHLRYAYSENFVSSIDALNYSPEQCEFLNQVSDLVFREGLRDIIFDRQSRYDVWVKDGRVLEASEGLRILRTQQVVLVQPTSKVSLKIKTRLNETALPDQIYQPLIEALGNNRPKTIGELEAELAPFEIDINALVIAILMLVSLCIIYPAQDRVVIEENVLRAQGLNAHLIEQTWTIEGKCYLACPVTASGVAIEPLHRLFLQAERRGMSDPKRWALFAVEKLCGINEGTKQESLDEITRRAYAFAQIDLPVLKTLRVI